MGVLLCSRKFVVRAIAHTLDRRRPELRSPNEEEGAVTEQPRFRAAVGENFPNTSFSGPTDTNLGPREVEL